MSRVPRSLQWRAPEAPLPAHPYRDTLLVYAALAAFIVFLAWVTGGSAAKATIVAVFFFTAASAWSVVRLRRRIRFEAMRRPAE